MSPANAYPAWLRTNHGEYYGQTVATIIRRVYGPKARLRAAADQNSPGIGLIVAPARTSNAWRVLAKVWEAGDTSPAG